MAVNVSPGEIGKYALAEMLTEEAKAHNIDLNRVEVEITEEAVLSDANAVAELEKVLSAGALLAIDDFGSGYSSFGILKKLRFNRLKIDRSFVSSLVNCPEDRLLVKAMIGLADALGIEVLAEGVEDALTCVTLYSLGCSSVQGYYVAQPMPHDELWTWLEEQGDRAALTDKPFAFEGQIMHC